MVTHGPKDSSPSPSDLFPRRQHQRGDFRTWHATVLAARALATAGPPPRSDRVRRRVVTQAVKAVAEELGNTPAVCRASYIDPRLVDLWEHGTTIRPTRSQRVAERETLRLLGG